MNLKDVEEESEYPVILWRAVDGYEAASALISDTVAYYLLKDREVVGRVEVGSGGFACYVGSSLRVGKYVGHRESLTASYEHIVSRLLTTN